MKKRRGRTTKEMRPASSYSLPARVERALELPVGALTGAAHIELVGNRRAVVEGCRGILEYSDDTVRLQTGSGTIRFTGRALSMSSLTEDSAVVEGFLLSLEYL